MKPTLKILESKPTIEGAGVRLKRAFGYNEAPLLDPFLLLDDFGSDKPRDYILGFPWHPHRGIETVTYVLTGVIKHEDSLGNKGVIESGDVQWMTAGSGIIHQEMPQQYEGRMWGFQLWVNLPASCKMMNPRYQEIKKEQIPEISFGKGITLKVICGEVKGAKGPVQDIIVDPTYLDVSLVPHAEFNFSVRKGHQVFAYIIEGNGYFYPQTKKAIGVERVVIFSDVEKIKISTYEHNLRFLLISGKPIKEPVAWYGPIVMNTQEELDVAFEEYRTGTFIKYRGEKK
ncbi:MAG: pirin family protein [candidate division WOR-3 bacterium]|nr:MAG: pirin family protein [candidate division WOR-3 bacterium]